MTNDTDRMGTSSTADRVDDSVREPPHTQEWHFPSGLSGPGCGLSLFRLPDGQLGEQHEQHFAEGTPSATVDCCDMQLIGQATRPRIVSSTWRVRNIGYAYRVRPKGLEHWFPLLSGPCYRQDRHRASAKKHDRQSVDCRCGSE